MFAAGTTGAVLMMVLGMSLVGPGLWTARHRAVRALPTTVRYSGSSLTFNLAGIFGASLAPYAATYLAKHYGLQYVGYYSSSAAILSLAGLPPCAKRRTRPLNRRSEAAAGIGAVATSLERSVDARYPSARL